MFDLKRTQRWMQAVIMHPGGIEAAMLNPNARVHMDVDPDDIETVVTRSKSLTAAERLGIYGRSYFARLMECLQAEFAVLRQALGDELFDMFTLAYLTNCPSRSFTLADLGGGFPGFLESTRPEQAHDEEEQWPDFIVDLARLERTFGEVFDGPGVEGQQLLSAGRLRELSLNRHAQVRLTPVVCLRLLSFQYPVHAYFDSVRRGQEPNVPLPAETFLAVNRRNYVVTMLELSASQHELLNSLVDGETVGTSLQRASASSPAQQEELVNCLEQWSEQGFFSSAGH